MFSGQLGNYFLYENAQDSGTATESPLECIDQKPTPGWSNHAVILLIADLLIPRSISKQVAVSLLRSNLQRHYSRQSEQSNGLLALLAHLARRLAS
jgi:hypothetical protein